MVESSVPDKWPEMTTIHWPWANERCLELNQFASKATMSVVRDCRQQVHTHKQMAIESRWGELLSQFWCRPEDQRGSHLPFESPLAWVCARTTDALRTSEQSCKLALRTPQCGELRSHSLSLSRCLLPRWARYLRREESLWKSLFWKPFSQRALCLHYRAQSPTVEKAIAPRYGWQLHELLSSERELLHCTSLSHFSGRQCDTLPVGVQVCPTFAAQMSLLPFPWSPCHCRWHFLNGTEWVKLHSS